MSILIQYLFAFVFITLSGTLVSSQNISLNIPLNKTINLWDKELYGDFVSLNRTSTLQINLNSVNKNVSFIILQVHSHLYDVTLYNNSYVKGSYVNGTNIGLYSSAQKLDVFFVYNPNDVDLQLFLSIQGYWIEDPIPGGCNMEFPVLISPYLRATYNEDFILVDGAAAKQYTDKNCNDVKSITVEFYRMYLSGLDEQSYFEGLRSMMSYEDVMENGEVIPETWSMWNMRRMLGAYPGTGSVYVAVAVSKTGFSVYVPTTTYACNPLDEDNGCVLLDDFLSQLLCASLLFIGVFLCYFGHRFFKTEMFLNGTASGALVTYIILAILAHLSRPALVGASLLSGVCFGAIWWIFWWFYGIPLFAVLLPTLNLGFLIAGVVFYGLPGGLPMLTEDINFWTLFIFIMLLMSTILLSLTLLSNILCCSILGAYAIVYPIDFYAGSSLKYILINTIRRATVPKFNRAVLAPPFELKEAMLSMLWVALSLTGFLFQHYYSRGRAPFPPPPRSISPRMPGDTRRYGAMQYGVIERPILPQQPTVPVPNENTVEVNERTPLI